MTSFLIDAAKYYAAPWTPLIARSGPISSTANGINAVNTADITYEEESN